MGGPQMTDFYYGPPHEPDSLTLFAPGWQDENITAYLQAHEVEVFQINKDRFMLVLPEGMVECRRLPVVIHEYLRYTLPDGTFIYLAHLHNDVAVSFDLDAFEQFRQSRKP